MKPRRNTMVTIPEMAAAEIEKNMSQENADDKSISIFIAGSKSVGKTTALHGFLEKDEKIRETLVLEYSFGRKSKLKQNLDKIICHIWEYGGSLELLKETMSCVPSQGHLTIVIMLDLSKPRSLWATLENCFQAIDELSKNPSKASRTIAIIGGKYDIFKNFDSDTKRIVTITVRSLALIYNAYIVFYSFEDQTLVKRLKQVFHYFGFGNGSFPKEKVVNFNKPLCIQQGADTWESIGVTKCNVENVKLKHLSLFPSELDDFIPSVSETAPLAHPEPILDSIKKKKYDEMLDVVDLSIIDYLKSL